MAQHKGLMSSKMSFEKITNLDEVHDGHGNDDDGCTEETEE